MGLWLIESSKLLIRQIMIPHSCKRNWHSIFSFFVETLTVFWSFHFLVLSIRWKLSSLVKKVNSIILLNLTQVINHGHVLRAEWLYIGIVVLSTLILFISLSGCSSSTFCSFASWDFIKGSFVPPDMFHDQIFPKTWWGHRFLNIFTITSF